MKYLIYILLIIATISCSTPKELVKSPDLLPSIQNTGNGKYTIVMDAGLGNWSLFYKPLAKKLAKKYRVCLIDRAGYAMDTVTTQPRDAKTIAVEMDKALIEKGITNNIILVGHSLGGLHVRMYQFLYPKKVKALILLDATNPNQFKQLPKEFEKLKNNQVKSLDKVIKLAQKDYLKYSKGKIPTFGLPKNLLDDYYKVTIQPEYYYTMQKETEWFEKSLKQVSKLEYIGNLPLLVIASKNSMNENLLPGKIKNYPFEEHNKSWLNLQKELSTLSSNSTFILSGKDHYLNVTDTNLVYNSMIQFLRKSHL